MDVEDRKAALRREIQEAEADVQKRESAIAERKKPLGFWKSMIKFDTGLDGLFDPLEGAALKRARNRVDDLRSRYQSLERAASAGNSFAEILELLHKQKQWIAKNAFSSEGSDTLTLVGITLGFSSYIESAEEQLLVLVSRGRQAVSKYYQEVGTWSRANLDAEIFRFGRDMDEISAEISRFERRDSVLTRSLAEALKEYRRLLQDVNYKLKAVRSDQSKSTSPEEVARRFTEKFQAASETVALMKERCEEEVKKHPDQEESIRRRYRKAIDAIMEAS